MPDHSIENIINFWFGADHHEVEISPEQRRRWFGKDPSTDQKIKHLFYPLVLQGGNEELGHFQDLQRGPLALILLLDQFSRHLWRGTPGMVQFDTLALHYASSLLKEGKHLLHSPVERLFLYLPLEHAEDLITQERSVTLFTELVEQVPEAARPGYERALHYAHRHREVIGRFGRFPHRNKILNRPSTPEEEAYLKTPGAGF